MSVSYLALTLGNGVPLGPVQGHGLAGRDLEKQTRRRKTIVHQRRLVAARGLTAGMAIHPTTWSLLSCLTQRDRQRQTDRQTENPLWTDK